jgi:hypothetical protein
VADAQRARAPVVMVGQRQLGKSVGVNVHIFCFWVRVCWWMVWLVGGAFVVVCCGEIEWMSLFSWKVVVFREWRLVVCLS